MFVRSSLSFVVVLAGGMFVACAHSKGSGNDAGPSGDASGVDGSADTCGDGVLDPGEGCDDGNTVSGDGCSAVCQSETCDATSCPTGCCSAAGACLAGVQDSACGMGGEVCESCAIPGELCQDQACQIVSPCVPNQTADCGLCGSRTCQSDTTWGACLGEGVCAVGQVEQGPACSCGIEERTCQTDCTWGPWSCQGTCPTLEMAYNGTAHFELDTPGLGASFNMHFLSILEEAGTLFTYHIQGYSGGGGSRFATGLALSTDGLTFQNQGIVLDVGGAWQRAFDAAADLSHQIGRADADGWSANTTDDAPAFLIFGPYQTGWSGPNVASYRLMVDSNADHTQVVTLDVYDSTGGVVLATRTLYRDDFSATMAYEIFNLSFTADPSHTLEFRVYWHDTTYTRVTSIATAEGQIPFFDDRIASFSGIWKSGSIYNLVYEGAGTSSAFPGDIGLATSTDGVAFSRSPDNPILIHSSSGWESANIGTPSLYEEAGTFYLYYHGFNGLDVQIGLATFTAGNAPQKYAGNPILPTSAAGWDSGTVGKRSRIIQEGSYYYMAYEGSTDPPYDTASWSTGLARSADLYAWTKSTMNPVLPVTTNTFGNDGPELIQLGGQYYLYVRSSTNTTDRYVLRAN